MGEVVKLQKSGKKLVIAIPVSICEHLDISEGAEVEIEPFSCSGETGARIRPKK